MRGKEKGTSASVSGSGITPAHAGKSPQTRHQCETPRDHPRTCGEKSLNKLPKLLILGSPPHMRGKAPNADSSASGSGITPAHAGKRPLRTQLQGNFRDHPRTCGEKQCAPCPRACLVGSPPHMRGKAPNADSSASGSGITPAHAGKRILSSISFPSIGDHPRTCGEKSIIYSTTFPP